MGCLRLPTENFTELRIVKGKKELTSKSWAKRACRALEYRPYDAATVRWLSTDPLEAHPAQIGKSTYSAMWNNPVLYKDPDGRCPRCFGDAGKGAWSAIAAFGEYVKETYETGGDNIVRDLNNLDRFGTLAQYAPAYAKDIFIQGAKQQVVNSVKTAGGTQAAASQAMGAVSVGVLTSMLGDKGASQVKVLVATSKTVSAFKPLSNITGTNINKIANYLKTLDSDVANDVMLDRLKKIESGDLDATDTDYNFYNHELREMQLKNDFGFSHDDAHARTLEEQGFNSSFGSADSKLYTPEAIEAGDAAEKARLGVK